MHPSVQQLEDTWHLCYRKIKFAPYLSRRYIRVSKVRTHANSRHQHHIINQ